MGTQEEEGQVLAFIEDEEMDFLKILAAIRVVKPFALRKFNSRLWLLVGASSLSSLPAEASDIDYIVSMGSSKGFPNAKWFGDFSRVLKPGGQIFVQQTLDASEENTTSSLECKLSVAGFSDILAVPMAEADEGLQSFGVKGKKPMPKVLVNDDMHLIDKDSLLSEEHLKKPELPRKSITIEVANMIRVTAT